MRCRSLSLLCHHKKPELQEETCDLRLLLPLPPFLGCCCHCCYGTLLPPPPATFIENLLCMMMTGAAQRGGGRRRARPRALLAGSVFFPPTATTTARSSRFWDAMQVVLEVHIKRTTNCHISASTHAARVGCDAAPRCINRQSGAPGFLSSPNPYITRPDCRSCFAFAAAHCLLLLRRQKDEAIEEIGRDMRM